MWQSSLGRGSRLVLWIYLVFVYGVVRADPIIEEFYLLDRPRISITPDVAKKLGMFINIGCKEGLCTISTESPERIDVYRYYYSYVAVYQNGKLDTLLDKTDWVERGYPMRYRFFVARDWFDGVKLSLFYLHRDDIRWKVSFVEGGLFSSDIRIYELDLKQYAETLNLSELH